MLFKLMLQQINVMLLSPDVYLTPLYLENRLNQYWPGKNSLHTPEYR